MSSLAPHLRELLDAYRGDSPSGAALTPVPGVEFFWSEEAIPRTPLLYRPGIVVIGQGHKVGHLGDRTFRYDEDTYLVLGMPIPFECETHATRKKPLLGIRIDVDVATLHELVAKSGPRLHLDSGTAPPQGVEPARMNDDLLEATVRLLRCLRDPIDSRVLGNAAVQEVIYRVLRGEHGRVLYSLTQHHTPYSAVARALDRIHSDYRESLSVEELAHESAMSVSAFHRTFKRVTGDSPLQYLKKIRLDKAKGLLVRQGMRVNAVAYEVGYESPSQFSREFRRYFRVPPSEAQSLAYS